MSEIDIVIEVVKQAPALIVLVWLVRHFLAHLQKRDEVLKELGDACHVVQREAIETIRQNSALYERVIDRLDGEDGRPKRDPRSAPIHPSASHNSHPRPGGGSGR